MDEDEKMDNEIVKLDDHRNKDDSETKGRRPERPRSTPIGKLRKLKCFKKVDNMVRSGVYVRKIAEYIQDVAGEYKGVGIESLARTIRNYRKSLEDAGNQVTIQVGQVSFDEDDPYYELHKLQEKYRQQLDRIDLEVATEKTLKKLFSTTHKEYEVLNHMTEVIMKLKRNLGIIGKHADRRRRIKSGYFGRMDLALVSGNAESRQKVLSLTEMILGDDELMDDLVEHGGLKGLQAKLDEAQEQGIELEELLEKKKSAKPKNKKKTKKKPSAKKPAKPKSKKKTKKKTTDKKKTTSKKAKKTKK